MDVSAASLFYAYWGKAKPAASTGAQYHLLPYHCLDVAAVGMEYLVQHEAFSHFFCQQLNCDKSDFLNWAAFWLALHDLGKFSEAFQSQREDIFELLRSRSPNPEKPYIQRHDSLGQWYWDDYLHDQCKEQKWFSITDKFSLDAWVRAVTGHHGQPPKTNLQNSPSDDFFAKTDKKAITEFVAQARDLFITESVVMLPATDPTTEARKAFEKNSEALSWWMAGVAVLADWLGSNTTYFPYKAAITPLADYWQYAQSQAKIALQASGVLPCSIKPQLVFKDFFPKIEHQSPLQQWASQVELTQSPQLFLLEDVTGAGKTEAAFILTYRLMATGNADGFFAALPTMATANAMYARVANFYAQLFSEESNLVLAHGSRNLVDAFAKSIVPESEVENDQAQQDETATARCTAWLADHNKRALLAQAGAGTIDQVLLAVLHSKHQSLRLLGLFGKVLIVDEVHACDEYMQGVLKIVLEFHARAGGSAILLSATLTKNMKQQLLAAYIKGRTTRDKQLKIPKIMQQAYPLVTHWQNHLPANLAEEPIATRSAVMRTVQINYVSELHHIKAQIIQALNAGQCVCWIRNTIVDALDAYAILSRDIETQNIVLFHARFCLVDRLKIEEKILHQFGEKSTHKNRRGQLVIATQVIEQSLDVDFDVMISDLAPIDRLIQRAGRLRRHVRDAQGNVLSGSSIQDQRGEVCLIVYGPPWQDEPSCHWIKDFLPKTGCVYPHHGQLWLTAKALQPKDSKTGSFTMPTDARHLIESVFSDDAAIPNSLSAIRNKVQGKQMADASHAKNNTLKLSDGYKRGDIIDWWSEAKTPSRLGEQSTTIFLACWRANRLEKWVADKSDTDKSNWAYSSLRIAERLIAEAEIPSELKNEYGSVLETLPDKGKWSVLLVLEKNQAGIWVTQAWSSNQSKPSQLNAWQYDKQFGLRMLDGIATTNLSPEQEDNE